MSQETKAARFLAAALANGPLPASELHARAKEAGIGEDALKKARRALGVKSMRGPDGWVVYLPNQWAEARRFKQLASDATRSLKSFEDAAALREFVGVCAAAARTANTPTTWKVPKSPDISPGTPVLFLSDLHWGEVVAPAEMNSLNAYNLAIARERLRCVVETAIDLFQRHLAHRRRYRRAVLLLGGDMVSGYIHEELRATNEAEIMESVLDCARHLAIAARRFAEEFGEVHVWGVPGNHGRSSMKPRFKQYAHTSFDWLIYHLLAVMTEGDKRIRHHLHDARECLIEVEGWRVRLMHGDQFRGGDGIIGPLGPITRGDVKRRYSAAISGDQHDLLVVGHFHRATWNRTVIVNGSLKGYDEYAQGNVIPFEAPIQMAWTMHARLGVNFIMPIVAPDCRHLWD